MCHFFNLSNTLHSQYVCYIQWLTENTIRPIYIVEASNKKMENASHLLHFLNKNASVSLPCTMIRWEYTLLHADCASIQLRNCSDKWNNVTCKRWFHLVRMYDMYDLSGCRCIAFCVCLIKNDPFCIDIVTSYICLVQWWYVCMQGQCCRLYMSRVIMEYMCAGTGLTPISA